MEKKLVELAKKSKEIIRSCVLPNGGIVAANSTDPNFSAVAKNYFYVWPRDGAYICTAALAIGIDDIQEDFFNWLQNRAEGFEEKHLLFEKYYPNGLQALGRFQPDQGASIIWAISNYCRGDEAKKLKFQGLITGLAEGICEHWIVDHFDVPTNDLWEERLTFPDIKDNFSYSIGACIKGLRLANEMFPDTKYPWVANEMETTLINSTKETNYFYRSYGLLKDTRVDASLLGLIWPFEIAAPDSELAKNTVDKIVADLIRNDGLYRYEHDEYDGWMYKMEHRKKGAGYWPLLNFWLAIVLSKMGRGDEAQKYFDKAVADVDEEKLLIPEQVFNNEIQKSVSPLCLSHAFYLLAMDELGML